MSEELLEIEAQLLVLERASDEKVFNYVLHVSPVGANFKSKEQYRHIYTNSLRINQFLVSGAGLEIGMDEEPIQIEHRPASHQTKIILPEE